MTLRWISAGRSDVGRKRVDNQDRILIDAQRGIYLVVDGMGGQAAGERAAQVATDIIQMRLSRHTGTTAKRIREAFALASTEIFELALANPDLRGMACVATVAVIEGGRVTVGHVGDSRLYLLEPGTLKKLTRDHSPVGEMEDGGKLGEDAAMRHPRRNEVYRDLGSAPHGPDDPDFVDVTELDLPASSALLLCSDGLTDQVPAEQIRGLVEQHAGDPQSGAVALIAAANDAGGKDNVSVVLVETPEYAVPERSTVPTPGRSRPSWTWFLAGLLTAAVLFCAARPYLEQTPRGTRVGFGTVRPPQTWLVGPNSLPSISEALDRALPGDRISVSPGEYHETIRLRTGVTLTSASPRAAKIQAPGIVVISNNVHGARFSGFDIAGPAEVGMQISNSEIEVENVTIHGMHGTGLEIDGGGSSFRSSLVEQNIGIGVYIHGDAHPYIDHNTITNNGHGPELLPGIYIAGSATPHLSGNVITRNGAQQVWISPFFKEGGIGSDNLISPTDHDSMRDIKVVTR